MKPEELGFKVDNLDERAIRFAKQREERGWDDSETWNLDHSIATFVLPRLRRFRELDFCHPPHMSAEAWNAAVDDMIYGMEVCAADDDFRPEIDWERVRKGLSLFGENFRHLWW
jgi:hypothetical protein